MTASSQAPSVDGLIGVEAVADAIEAKPEVFVRTNKARKDGLLFEVCINTAPDEPIDDDTIKVLCAFEAPPQAYQKRHQIAAKLHSQSVISAHLEALRAAGYEIIDMKARGRQFAKERLRDRPELTALIAKSRAAYEAMPPEEREAHDKAQRDSWVRGNIELDRLEHEEMRASPPCDTKGETDG